MGQKETDKKDQGKKDGAGSSGGDGVVTVVLKVDLHCEGCAQKVKRTVKRLNGVESVNTDFAHKKITVVGKVDPTKVKEKVEEKTKKKVDLLAPQPPKKDKDGGGTSGGKGGGKSSDEPPPADNNKKADQKKPKEVSATTVVLKTRVHCDGCANKINKIISKREGVKEVKVDLPKDQVTVKGTMDMKEMLPYLNTKLKRVVEIVPPPKKDEGGNKKAKDGNSGGGEGGEGGGDNKGKEAAKADNSDGGGDKKGKEDAKPNGSGDNNKKKKGENSKGKNGGGGGEGENASKIEVVNRMEYFGYPYGNGAYTYNPQQAQGNGYVAEYWNGPDYMNAPPHYLHAPQMFSDENPNACSIM